MVAQIVRIYSSILAWRIPRTDKPGGLQPVGSQGVRQNNSATNTFTLLCFPGGSDGKESACNTGDLGLIPGLGRSPEEGNGFPFQYSCLENSMDRGAWKAIVHEVTASWTQLSDFTSYIICQISVAHFYLCFFSIIKYSIN